MGARLATVHWEVERRPRRQARLQCRLRWTVGRSSNQRHWATLEVPVGQPRRFGAQCPRATAQAQEAAQLKCTGATIQSPSRKERDSAIKSTRFEEERRDYS